MTLTGGAAVAAILAILAIAFGYTAFWGWVLMLVLGAVGAPLGFWPCVGIMALVNIALGLLSRS